MMMGLRKLASRLWPLRKRIPQNDELQQMAQSEARLLKLPQLQLPVTHHFAPGCYGRELFMPAGSFVMGHEHKTRHFNVLLTGRMRVLINGAVREMVAPCICVSEPGTRKAALILEDVRWVTFHPTEETDIQKLEDDLVIKSPAYLEHEERERLRYTEAQAALLKETV